MLSYLGWALDRIIFFGGGCGGRRGFQPKRLLETRVLDRMNFSSLMAKKPVFIGPFDEFILSKTRVSSNFWARVPQLDAASKILSHETSGNVVLREPHPLKTVVL